MDKVIDETQGRCDALEVRIALGIDADDVESILNMAAASGIFSSDIMMTAEDMAWNSAYGDGGEPHTFLRATIDECGDTRMVGFICFGPIPNWPDSFELYCMAVAPEFHRLGIGTALLLEMNRQIAMQKGNRVYLETGSDRIFENARLFYEANSFIQEHRYIKRFPPTNGGIIYRYDIHTGNVDNQYQ